MSIGIVTKITRLEKIQHVINRLSTADLSDLLDTVGQLIENQVKNRILEEKTDPEGNKWKPWSDKYPKTRHGNQSLLVNEGNLHDSIQHVVSGSTLEVGSNLPYAAAQALGTEDIGGDIPSRQYLGLSDENQDEVEKIVTLWLKELTA